MGRGGVLYTNDFGKILDGNKIAGRSVATLRTKSNSVDVCVVPTQLVADGCGIPNSNSKTHHATHYYFP